MMMWYDMLPVFLCFDTFLETRANMLKSIGYGLDFDRDGHVTFARELWQPDRVNSPNFGNFYGVDFGKFWPVAPNSS